MTEFGAQDLTATYDCKRPNCTEAARTNRGPNAYLCDRHREERERTARPRLRVATSPLADETKKLARLAVAVDKARAAEAKYDDRCLALREAREKAEDAYRNAAQSLLGLVT